MFPDILRTRKNNIYFLIFFMKSYVGYALHLFLLDFFSLETKKVMNVS